MWISKAIDWHDLTEKEREEADISCNNRRHGKLSEEKGPLGGNSDYICADCGILKSGQQWRSEGLLK